MAAQEVIVETNPAQPVPFSESAVAKVLEDNYLIADTKKDGVQLNLIVGRKVGKFIDNVAEFLSRAGKYLPALQAAYKNSDVSFSPVLTDDCCIYPDGFMLQAEITIPGQPAEVTSGLLRRTKVTPKDPRPLLELGDIEIHVFGVVPLSVIESGEDHDVSHAVMKYHVESIVPLLQKHVPQIKWFTIESQDVFSMEELNELYEARRAAGEEGLVAKDPNAIWKRGKKVGQWKVKPEDTIDGKVTGLVWGTPGLANEGKVIGFEVELEDGMVVNACGLKEEQKAEFTETVMEANFKDPFDFNWLMPQDQQDEALNPYEGWAVEVSFMERFKDGSLRHPTFNRWRGISSPFDKE